MDIVTMKTEANVALKEYGIDKIIDLADDLMAFGEGLDKRLADGKLTLTEKITLTPKLIAVATNFKDRKIIWLQFKDIDAEERQQLIDHVKKELDLENDQAELLAEAIWGAIISLSLIINFKKVLKAA
jgi:hypothetical protein